MNRDLNQDTSQVVSLNPAAEPALLKALRYVGHTEGVSFLLLLFIATPLKHFAGNPMPVKVLGPIHGGLFLLYIAMAIAATIRFRWSWTHIPLAVIASIMPFGPFVYEAWLRRRHEAA
jgi:integral membrane protein